MSYLIVRNGTLQGKTLTISGDANSLGRNLNNSIVLPDDSISRFHAEIRCLEDQVFIRDLQSTYGTYVNGTRCQPELPVAHGDCIRLGKIELLFHADQGVATDNTELKTLSAEKEFKQAFPSGGNETISYRLPAGKESFQKNLTFQYADLLSRMADSMQSVVDLEDRLHALMNIVFEVFKPDRGAVLLREREDALLEVRWRRPEDNVLIISNTILEHAISQRHALLIFDASTDERFKASLSVMALNIRSAICAPLVNRNKVLGAIYIDSQSCSFTYQKEDLALLNLLAANAAISIENAILVREKLESERLAAIGMAMAGISHFAKNVLTGIMGASELMTLALKKGDLPMLSRVWAMLQQSTDTLSVLVHDMLSYSKRREPEWQDANLNETIREIFEIQAPLAQEKGVGLVLELEEDLPNSNYDKKAIHDVLLNILINAIEACSTQKGSRILINTFMSPDGNQIGATVIDNGPGIHPEMQKKIFEPFFSTKGSKGTGLGLAMARKTVMEHGGQLLMESELERGASFRMILPLRGQETQKSDELT